MEGPAPLRVRTVLVVAFGSLLTSLPALISLAWTTSPLCVRLPATTGRGLAPPVSAPTFPLMIWHVVLSSLSSTVSQLAKGLVLPKERGPPRSSRSGPCLTFLSGGDLLSQGIAPQVPSALAGLTTGFGM